jgi:hypothetical protein
MPLCWRAAGQDGRESTPEKPSVFVHVDGDSWTHVCPYLSDRYASPTRPSPLEPVHTFPLLSIPLHRRSSTMYLVHTEPTVGTAASAPSPPRPSRWPRCRRCLARRRPTRTRRPRLPRRSTAASTRARTGTRTLMQVSKMPHWRRAFAPTVGPTRSPLRTTLRRGRPSSCATLERSATPWSAARARSSRSSRPSAATSAARPSPTASASQGPPTTESARTEGTRSHTQATRLTPRKIPLSSGAPRGT